MMDSNTLLMGGNLATIATWVMVVGMAIVLYLEKATPRKKSSHRSPKK